MYIVLNVDQAPIATDLTSTSISQNVEQMITLPYTASPEVLATSCEVTDLTNLTETTPCSCDTVGVCTVGLTGITTGTATFNFTVTAANQTSNIASVTFLVTNVAAIAANLTPTAEFQLIEKIYILNYTDENNDLATACTISNLNNATISTSNPCTCDGSGVCTVGIIGDSAAIASGASFDYTVTTNAEESNTATVTLTINQIGASINDEWIKVPANAGNMGLPAFYVMKYEAKAWLKNDTGATANEDNIIDAPEVDSDGLGAVTTTDDWVDVIDYEYSDTTNDGVDYYPVSIPTNQPWREIYATSAATRCESLGANYHLISNDEWMAIARDIEQQDQNWTGGLVGDGCLFRGNTGEATTGDGTNSADSCGYDAATDPDSGTTRDLRAIHTLSNGYQIYDFAGNLWEWTDWDKDTLGFQVGPNSTDGDACPSSGEIEDILDCPALNDDDFRPLYLYPDPTPDNYTDIGFGYFYSYNGAGGAALRGGLVL